MRTDSPISVLALHHITYDADAEENIAKDPTDFRGMLGKISAQYAVFLGCEGG